MAGHITASAFNRLGQYASCTGNRVYCYAELAVSSLAVAYTTVSTHGGMARLSRPGWLVKYQNGIPVSANCQPSEY